MADAWLRENPPNRSQYRSPRRERPSGVMVVHTAENTPDTVATDGGAEAVANFIRNRTDAGSYHDLVDSDSAIQLVRYSDEAFQDGTGSNPHAWGGSVATTAAWWPVAPEAWRNGAIRRLGHAAARYAHWLRDNYGIVVPARRINRVESEARVPGFISHAERDPTRRSDPGAHFPWDQFLATYAAAYNGQPLEDDMPLTAADSPIIEAAVRKVLDEGTALGQSNWAGTSKADLATAQHLVNQTNLILKEVRERDDVDTGEFARALAPELVPLLAEAAPDATELAQAVVDLLPADDARKVAEALGELIAAGAASTDT